MTTTEPSLWAVHKVTRLYDGGSYNGPSPIAASLPAGPYKTRDRAEWVAKKLDAVNAVGWEVVPYRPRKTV
jgi:hypothetical protein